MKKFLKDVAAVFVGMAIFSVCASVVAVIGFAGMIGSIAASSSTSVKDGSVLVLKLDGIMSERSNDPAPMDYLRGYSDGTMGLKETLQAIGKAKADDKVKGIYIEAGSLVADVPMMKELRDALADFKKSGKWIIAYADGYSAGSYYVSSVANKVYVNPIGGVDWRGMGGQLVFVKDLLAKLGVKVVPFKCGKYKSATEMFTEDHMSGPSREQTQRYLNGWWQMFCNDVARSRGISVDSLNSYADRVIGVEDTKNLIKYKMVDGLLYADQVKDVVKKQLGLKADDDIQQIEVSDLLDDNPSASGDKVAVYYACGDIVDTEPEQNLFQGGEYIVGNDMCDDLQDLADDDDVKAVVLRINSPGGSAYASEQIWHAIEMLKQKKPVVVSMSGYAASGGYYISSAANYIFAEPTTLTGSIGIYGLVTDQSELMTKKLGLKYDAVQTNRNTLFGSVVTPMTAEQQRLIQGSIDRGYLLFKSRVAKGRNLSMAAVEERAQGHVFLGSDALKLKLVDQLGGLDKAVAKAAQLAKIRDYKTVDYPEQEDFLTQLLDNSASKGTYLDEKLRLVLGDFYGPLMIIRGVEHMDRVQARMPYFLLKQ